MKLFLALLGFALLANHGINADKALADKLKPYEAFSPYEWTKWVELRPPQGPRPIAVASVSFSPQAAPAPAVEDSDEDSDEDVSLEVLSPFDQWFKRAILPQPPVTKKPKKLKDPSATKKPSIVAVPLDYWSPPPSVAPNVTFPPPPGYYAAKKSMFISKLFAALAASVLNETGPIAPSDTETTTTVSPRQAILDEIQSVLLSDVPRSLPVDDDDVDSDETEESDEDSDEAAVTAPIKLTPTQQLAALRLAAVKAATPVQPAAPVEPAAPTTTTTENPFLLKRLDFLEKLTAAVLAQPTAPLAPIPTKAAPVVATTPAPYKGKPGKGGKAGKKAKGKKAPPTPKPPKYLKYLPTTTTTVAPPEIDYEALAQALLSGSGK